MFLTTSGLFALIEIGLLVFCVIEVIQTPADEVRGLGKGWWILLIIVVPLIGSIAWLMAGRPIRPSNPKRWPLGSGFAKYEHNQRRAPLGPDDDPEFLNEIRQINKEQEEILKKGEADLKRREAEQRLRESDAEE